MKAIAVVGLGYVGLPLAVEFGKSRSTIGFDINQDRIALLSSSYDTNLKITSEDLQANKFLKFSSDLEDLRQVQIFIVAVPTPIDHNKQPDFLRLVKASKTIGTALKKEDIVIYESTVYPGVTEDVCVRVLEKPVDYSSTLISIAVTHRNESIQPIRYTHIDNHSKDHFGLDSRDCARSGETL